MRLRRRSLLAACDAGYRQGPGHCAHVLATVPIEQRETIKRRSLAIPNDTPVIVLDDPDYRALARNTSGFQSPKEPVLVRITKGVDQGRELIVRRQDLTGPEPRSGLLSRVTVCFFTLIGAAAALSSIETLVLKLRARRESDFPELTIGRDSRPGRLGYPRKPATRISDRGKRECDQWLASVADLTFRRKARCLNLYSHAAGTSQCRKT